MKIPFIVNGGNKSNIFNEKQLDLNFKINSLNLLDIVHKLSNNNDNINIIKASETKKYYEKLKKKEN